MALSAILLFVAVAGGLVLADVVWLAAAVFGLAAPGRAGARRHGGAEISRRRVPDPSRVQDVDRAGDQSGAGGAVVMAGTAATVTSRS